MQENDLRDSMPETGSAKCVCSEERVIVSADLWPDPNVRTVNVAFWTSGGHFASSPTWRLRLQRAWSWLRGQPETTDGVLLDREETLKLVDALKVAHDQTWPDNEE